MYQSLKFTKIKVWSGIWYIKKGCLVQQLKTHQKHLFFLKKFYIIILHSKLYWVRCPLIKNKWLLQQQHTQNKKYYTTCSLHSHFKSSIMFMNIVFSSPELKWKFKRAICLSVSVSVCPFINFLHFLQNHWANFNLTWHKALLGEGDSNLLKWRAHPLSRGNN